MKSAHLTLLMLGVTMILLGGCRAGETTSNTATPSPVSNSNATGNSNQSDQATASNRNAGAPSNSGASDSTKAKATPQLIGTYESREVVSQGVVTVMSKLRTTWKFYENGSYGRISLVNGKT